MELDESGYPQPTGRFETLEADTVILALGQESDTAFLRSVPGVEFDRDGTVRVSSSLMTGCPGVFAGGDMVPSERTVTIGVGHGKRAAREIDAWLRDSQYAPATKHPVAEFELLNLWYFGDHPRRRQPELTPEGRLGGFEEIVGGLSPEEAVFEAQAVPVVRELHRVRRLPGRMPRRCGDQARRGTALQVRLRPLHRLPRMLRAVPGSLDRDGAGGGA